MWGTSEKALLQSQCLMRTYCTITILSSREHLMRFPAEQIWMHVIFDQSAKFKTDKREVATCFQTWLNMFWSSIANTLLVTWKISRFRNDLSFRCMPFKNKAYIWKQHLEIIHFILLYYYLYCEKNTLKIIQYYFWNISFICSFPNVW